MATAIAKIDEVIDFLRKESDELGDTDPGKALYLRIWSNGMTNAKRMIRDTLEAASPAWHDKPTCDGSWLHRLVTEAGVKHDFLRDCGPGEAWRGGRWFGPIPDTE